MAEILTRTGLRSLVDTNLPSGTGAITAENHRGVEDSLIDSLATIFETQIPVINMSTTAPPGGAGDRDAYVVASGGTGAWSGKDGEIAVWDDDKTGGGGWQFSGTPSDGAAVWNLADDKEYRYDAGAGSWGERTVATSGQTECLIVAAGDESTAITTGTAKVTFRMPYAFTLSAVRASLTAASSSGAVTVDINESGTSILSTKLTIDASEKTSTTAATAAVISDTALADDAEITIDVDGAGTGAAGLKVYLIGTQA